MAKIYDLLAREDGRAISHFRSGYETLPNSMMLFYPLDQLNNPKFDFRSARPKKMSYETQKFSDDKSIVWYEDNIKEIDATTTSAAAAGVLSFDVDLTNIVEGEVLINKTSGDVMLVLSVTGNTITVDQNPTGIVIGDKITRGSFAKAYGKYDAMRVENNDYVQKTNYVQFMSTELDPTKTDILTNNLKRLFYKDAKEYIEEELFAPASRKILMGIMRTLYKGQARVTSVTGGTRYMAGGLEHYLPVSALDINIKGATDKDSVLNFRTQLQKAYASGVGGIHKRGRVVFFCTTGMAAQMDDLFYDKITDLDNHLSSFGINVVDVSLNGRKISIVEDSVMNDIYGEDAKVGFIMDIEGVKLWNLMDGVVGDDGKSVPKLGASQIWVKPQETYETKQITLNTHFSFVFENVSSGLFRKIIYE